MHHNICEEKMVIQKTNGDETKPQETALQFKHSKYVRSQGEPLLKSHIQTIAP